MNEPTQEQIDRFNTPNQFVLDPENNEKLSNERVAFRNITDPEPEEDTRPKSPKAQNLSSKKEAAPWETKAMASSGDAPWDTKAAEVEKAPWELASTNSDGPLTKFGKNVVGIGEGALNFVSGAIAAPAMGLRALGEYAFTDADMPTALDRAQSSGDAATYSPRTAAGEDSADMFSDAYQWGRTKTGGLTVALTPDSWEPATRTIGEAGFDLAAIPLGLKAVKGARGIGRDTARPLDTQDSMAKPDIRTEPDMPDLRSKHPTDLYAPVDVTSAKKMTPEEEAAFDAANPDSPVTEHDIPGDREPNLGETRSPEEIKAEADQAAAEKFKREQDLFYDEKSVGYDRLNKRRKSAPEAPDLTIESPEEMKARVDEHKNATEDLTDSIDMLDLEDPSAANGRVSIQNLNELQEKLGKYGTITGEVMDRVQGDKYMTGQLNKVKGQIAKINDMIQDRLIQLAQSTFIKDGDIARAKAVQSKAAKWTKEITDEKAKLQSLGNELYSRMGDKYGSFTDVPTAPVRGVNKGPGGKQSGAINPEVFADGFRKTKKLLNGFYLEAIGKGDRLMVNIINPKDEHVGGAVFRKNGESATAGGTVIGPEYQGKGLGTEMYKFVSDLGNDVKASDAQLPAGKAMWDSFHRKGIAENDQIPAHYSEKVKQDTLDFTKIVEDQKKAGDQSGYEINKGPGGKQRGAAMNPWERKEPGTGKDKDPVTKLIAPIHAENTLKGVAKRLAAIKDSPTYRDLSNALLPLAGGPAEASGIIKTFANKNATAMYAKARLTDILNKLSKGENEALYKARQADELAEKTGTKADNGVGSLNEKLKLVAEVVQNDYIDALREAQASGTMVGGFEHYTPRKLVAILSDKTVKDIAAVGRRDAIGGVFGPKKNMGGLNQRKYGTVEQTEAAARSHFGDNVEVVKDIRVLPLVTSELRRVSATKSLLESLRKYGNDNFLETVSTEPVKNWMSLNHPAFKNVWIHPDFHPAIESILNARNSNIVVRGLMTVKSKSMGLLMFNPFVHGTVIYSKAIPYDPMRIISGAAYMKGGALRGSPLPDWMYDLYGVKERASPEEGWAYQKDAMEHGFRPTSNFSGGARMEVTDLYETPGIGKSWTSQLVGQAARVFDKQIEAKQAVDKVGEFWHGSMLWNRINDLGMYIYDKAWKDLVKEGMSADAAKVEASHIANRYMGTVPVESMSQSLRTFLNLVLFSRQFNVTNLGIYKDVISGLPNEIRGQIQALGKEGDVQIGDRYLKNKQTNALAIDIIVMNLVMSSLIQSGIAAWKKYKDLGEGIKQETVAYAKRLGDWFERMGDDPTAFFDPQITPMSKNEPGKEDRVYLGNDENGTGMYMKNPFGKVGEDLTKSFSHPMDLALSKQSQLMKVIGGNDFKGGLMFGNKDIYGPNNKTMNFFEKIGATAKVIVDSLMPFGNTDALQETLKGNPNKINMFKTAGSLTPVSFSKGYPGGPEKGVLSSEQKADDFKFMQAKRGIDNAIDRGQIEEALDTLQAHGKSPTEAVTYVKQRITLDKPNVEHIKKMYEKGDEDAIREYQNVNNY